MVRVQGGLHRKLPFRSIVDAYFDSLGAFVGGMGMRYSKPYMVHVGADFEEGYLYDARFEGFGGMGGLWMGPRDKWPYFEFMGAFGRDRVRLTNKLDIEDRLAVKGGVSSVMYMGRVGYRYPILERAPRLVIGANGSFEGATFFLSTEDEKGNSTCDGSSCPSLNHDFFWSGGLEATLAF